MFETNILQQVFNYDKSSKSIIDIDELVQGCAVPDCIPVIEKPLFTEAKKVEFMQDDDLILLVEYNQVSKAYPVKIMRIHEILNDDFAGKPLTVTYCTLCATALAFVPLINNELVKFSTTGLLHNSNMVMFDDLSRTLWNQLTGKGIVGPHSGEQLQREYVALRTWKQIKSANSGILVLNPTKESEAQPMLAEYTQYIKNHELLFPVAAKDERMGQKEMVWGFVVDGQAVAIHVESPLLQSGTTIDVKQRQIMIKLKTNGLLDVKDVNSGELFNATQAYWFAWFNFHTDTIEVD